MFVWVQTEMKQNFLFFKVVVQMLVFSVICVKVISAIVVTRKPVPRYHVDWWPEPYRKSLVQFDEVILCTPWPVILVSWSIITVIWWCRKSSARLDFLLLLFNPSQLNVAYFVYFIVVLQYLINVHSGRFTKYQGLLGLVAHF